MKLWLTLIFGTIGISASMTYLVMHQGAQTLPDTGSQDPEYSTPSKAEFGKGKIDGNVLVVDAGPSHVGKRSTVTIPIKCTSPNAFKIELLSITCSCVHPLSFGTQEVLEKKPMTLKPGESIELRIPFTPKDEQAKTPKYRFFAKFLTNDPQYSPTFRIQVETEVLQSEGTK